MTEDLQGDFALANVARQTPAVFVNKVYVQTAMNIVKITFGELMASPQEAEMGSIERFFQGRTAVLMHTSDLREVHDIIGKVLVEADKEATQKPAVE